MKEVKIYDEIYVISWLSSHTASHLPQLADSDRMLDVFNRREMCDVCMQQSWVRHWLH